MKLYATVTSERATKGQGGEYLDIEVMGEDKTIVARIKVTKPSHIDYQIDVFPVAYPDKLTLDIKGHGYSVKRTKTKGEKQKGEVCKQCDGSGKVDIGFKDKADCHNCNGTGNTKPY